MFTIKRWAAVCMVLLISIGVCGCMADYFKGKNAKVEETLEYLSEKYNGQKFVYESSETLYGKLLIYCYPDWGTYKTEKVRVRREVVDGKVQYKDTYFNIIMREDAEAEVVSVCAELGLQGKAFIYTSNFYINNQFDGTKTYADYVKWDLEDGEPSTRTYVLFINADDSTDCEAYADEIVDRLKNRGVSGTIDICFCTNEQYEYSRRDNLYEAKNAENVISVFRAIE